MKTLIRHYDVICSYIENTYTTLWRHTNLCCLSQMKNTNGLCCFCQNLKYKWLLQGKGSQIQINNKTIIEFGSRIRCINYSFLKLFLLISRVNSIKNVFLSIYAEHFLLYIVVVHVLHIMPTIQGRKCGGGSGGGDIPRHMFQSVSKWVQSVSKYKLFK